MDGWRKDRLGMHVLAKKGAREGGVCGGRHPGPGSRSPFPSAKSKHFYLFLALWGKGRRVPELSNTPLMTSCPWQTRRYCRDKSTGTCAADFIDTGNLAPSSRRVACLDLLDGVTLLGDVGTSCRRLIAPMAPPSMRASPNKVRTRSMSTSSSRAVIGVRRSIPRIPQQTASCRRNRCTLWCICRWAAVWRPADIDSLAFADHPAGQMSVFDFSRLGFGGLGASSPELFLLWPPWPPSFASQTFSKCHFLQQGGFLHALASA